MRGEGNERKEVEIQGQVILTVAASVALTQQELSRAHGRHRCVVGKIELV